MPMMQFSVAPWRVLSKEHFNIILDMYKLHVKFAPKFIELAKEASVTGEPIVRALEYVFPNEGYGRTFDAFMLGNDILVAPVYEKDTYTRTVRLPKGTWKDELGVVYEGGCEVTVDAPLERLPYFERV
jgi:alpha-glucosidase